MALVEEPPVATPAEELKVFVGGIPFHFSNEELKQAFERFGATEAIVMIDRRTNKSRGFGFVIFADPAGRDEAIMQMHDTELDTRRISVTRAIPQDQTAPGTPAAALGGGRREGVPVGRDRGYSRPYDRGYDRGYDRAAPYDRYGDRYGGGGGGGGYSRTRPYEPRYPPYGSRPYEFREPYAPRDPYMPAYEFDRGYRGMSDRGAPYGGGGYDDRYRPGPDRRVFGGGSYDRGGMYDRGMRR